MLALIIAQVQSAVPLLAKELCGCGGGITDGTSSLSFSPLSAGGWITFAEARRLFSTKSTQYAFGETDRDGRRNIESFAAQHRSVINFMPVERRV